MASEIPVGRNGLVALVDDEDYDLVGQFTWYAQRSPHSIYAYRKWREDGRRRTQKMHSLLTGWPEIDHHDHDGLNNQRSNLRPVTRSQNLMNARKRRGTSSRYKGVCWARQSGKWVAKIRLDKRLHHLGLFDDEADAARAYDAAARKHFREFACVNFPLGEEIACG